MTQHHKTRTGRGLVAATASLAVAAAVLAPIAYGGPSDAATPRTASAVSEAPDLFGPAPARDARLAPDRSVTHPKRSRYVSFRSDLLPTQAKGQELGLRFFDDAAFTGTVEHVLKQPLFTTWTGPLDSQYGTFVVTKTGDQYSVTASTTRGSVTMTKTRNGQYQVEEVDQPHVTAADTVSTAGLAATSTHPRVGKAPSSTRLITFPTSNDAKASARRHGGRGGDDGSTEDLFVLFTANAMAAYGGLAGMEAEIAKNLGYTNSAYANSGVKTTARLVGIAETPTAELGGGRLGNDLNRLIRKGDGYYDDVFKDIKITHADETVLLVEPPPASAPICGIAPSAHNQPAKYAFAAVSTGDCTNGYYSFPHEIGHTQGAEHDLWTLKHDPVGQGSLDAQYHYGYGYVAPNYAFYTIMAYYSECVAKTGNYCPQLLNFSNPGIAYGGQPIGTRYRNNVSKLITKTRHRVAGHLQSQLYPTPVHVKPKPVAGHTVRAAFKPWINGGVHYSYQWFINGQPAKHGQHRTFRIKGKYKGATIAVAVGGAKRYYARTGAYSKARKIKGGKGHHRDSAVVPSSSVPFLTRLLDGEV